MRMKKTGILAGIMATCMCMAQTVPAFGAQQDLVGFVPNEENQTETQVKSYLTGENVPESIGRRRPVAINIFPTEATEPPEACCRNDGQ